MLLKYKLFIFAFLFYNFIYAQDHSSKSYNEGITVGHIDTLYSELLQEEREILIYLPESLKHENYRRDQYPVLYLLDGRNNFLLLAAMVQQYAERNDSEILPEMIIVGLSNKNHQKRIFDYSPTEAGNPKEFGGGDLFLKFMKEELFPYIENQYPAANENRTFIGHSFGGVAVLNALSRHPEMFENYLSIDGSIWFDNKLFLNDPEFSLKDKELAGKNLFIGIANTAQYGSTLESIRTDTLRVNRYVRHSLDLIQQIEESSNGLNLDWTYYENDSHGSSVLPAQLDALRFFYSWFEFKEERKYMGKYNLPTAEEETFARLTEKHFKMVSEELGYEYFPTVPWLLGKADMLLNFHKLPEQAKELLLLTSKYYPENEQVAERLEQLHTQPK